MSFNDLPVEMLRMIVVHLESEYVSHRDPGVFDIMRVNRLLRDLAFEVHFVNDLRLQTFSSKGKIPEYTVITPQRIALILWDEKWSRNWQRISSTQLPSWPGKFTKVRVCPPTKPCD